MKKSNNSQTTNKKLTKNQCGFGQVDFLVMQNGSIIRYKIIKNDLNRFEDTDKCLPFCPECGCPTNIKTGAIMCNCFA